MNTKTTKFLAVMAVLAFAFAAFAVAAPAQDNDAALPEVAWNAGSGKITGATEQILEGVTSITDSEKIYYYLEDTSVSIPSGKTGLVFFVKVGATVTISASGAAPYADSVVAVVPVSSVTVNNDTVTVQQAASENFLTDAPETSWTTTTHVTVYTLLAIHVNEVYKLKASSTGMIVQSGTNDEDYYGASFTLEGTFSKKVNLKGATQNVKYINFTGTISDGATELVLTRYTGEIDLATGVFTVAKWDAGDVEVLKAAQSKVLLRSNIFEGSTLYVDGGQFAETDGTSYYNGSADPTANFVNSGTISIKQGKTADDPPVTNYGNFTLADADMQNEGTITNLGAFYSAKKIENTGKIVTGHSGEVEATTVDKIGFTVTEFITNNGTFTFKETTVASNLKFSPASTGEIKNQVASNKNVSGIITNDTYQFNQSATIIGNTTLSGTLVLNGVLTVNEGVTLTIVNGGKIVMGSPQSSIVNNGTIDVQAATGEVTVPAAYGAGAILNTAGFIANNGEIVLSNPAIGDAAAYPTLIVGAVEGTAAFLKNYGSVTNSAGIMQLNATGVFLNMAKASFLNEGTLTTEEGTTISNAGYFGINGAITATVELPINITDKAAVFEVIEMKLGTSAITIVNKVSTTPKASVEFPATETNIITGLKVSTYKAAESETKSTNGFFVLSGNASYFDASYGIADTDYIVTLNGTKAYIGDLVLNEKVRIGTGSDGADVPAATQLFFIGTAMMVDSGSAKIEVGGGFARITATVEGKVITSRAPLSAAAEGVVKVLDLNAAMYTVTNDSYVKTYYYTTLDKAISEASDIGADKGEVTATGATEIASDLTIPAPIKLKNQGIINIKDGADVVVVNGASINNSGTINVNGSLYAAVAKTGLTGSTTDTSIVSDVKVVSDPSVLYTNLYDALSGATAGDTVVITKDGAVTLTKDTIIPVGVVLDTNEKELKTRTGDTDADKKYKLTVNGTLQLYAAADFKAYGDIVLNGYIVSDDKRTFSTTGLTGAYFETEVSNVDYYYIAGVKNLADITASGITTVDVYGDISLPTIEFDGTSEGAATVKFNGNVDVTTIDASKAVVVFAYGTTVTTTVTDGTNAVKLNGDVPATSNDKKLTVTLGDKFAVAGEFEASTIDADDFEFAVSGTTSVGKLNTYDLTVAGLVTAAGNIDVTNDLVVTGTLNVSEDYSIKASSAMVTGTLSSAGSATITDITIGSTTSAVQAAASVGGDGTYTVTTVVLFAGNGVADAIIENMKSSEFYIDGKLWFTVYSKATTVTLADMTVPVTDSKAVGIDDKTGGLFIDGKKLKGSFTVGKQDFDIEVKYDIYSVTIYTDAGVKAVYIDGQVMKSPWSGENEFTLEDLEAGTYKVTYTLMNGYEGTAQLYTADGTILKDNSFVLSGTTMTDVVLQLLGTEKEVAPEPSPVEQNEWTITTILLVILVVLIAVMAVIVALRLNRS